MNPLVSALVALGRQHEQDLMLYRSAHKNFFNRLLHWLLIPCETASFFLFLAILFKAVSKATTPASKDIAVESKGDKRNCSLFPDNTSIGHVLLSSFGWTLGILSLILYVQPNNQSNIRTLPESLTSLALGMLACAFHVGLAPLCSAIVGACGLIRSVSLATIVWTLAWGLQVGVGHYLLEQNQPNVANIQEVSTLAMVTSVVIAWKS